MPTYTFLGQTPNDGTYEVGSGPFPDLPAGTYKGNFYGNDPRLGIIQAGDQRYSLPRDERDASSSGNTFQVGTGPQPNLPAGRFLPGQIAGAVRRNTQAQEAAARAAQPPPAPVSPTPIAGPAVPAQTTLPDPTTPVAVPSFVSSTGLPNFGSSNLLAQTSVPGTTAGLSNVPGIVSPIQPLLETSTLPATGGNALSVPNITPNLASQSAFTQLFPSIPDISLTAAAPTTSTALAADGGPILASDYLPRYQGGTEVESLPTQKALANIPRTDEERERQNRKDYGENPSWFLDQFGLRSPVVGPGYGGEAEGEARRKAEVLSQLRPYFPRWTEDQLAALNDMPLPQLEEMLKRHSESSDKPFSKFLDDILRDRQEQQAETWMDMAPPQSNDVEWVIDPRSTNPFTVPQTEFEMQLQEPGGNEEYARQENFRRALTEGQNLDVRNRFIGPGGEPGWGRPDLRPGELQGAANGGPILASEYLNAGGPVQYFSNGGNTGVLDAAPPGHFPAYITSDEAEMLRAQGGGVTPDGGQYMANGIPVFQSTTGNQSVSDAVSFGQTEADVAQSVQDAQNAAFEASLEEAGKTEGTKIGRIPNPIQQGSRLTPDQTLGPVLGGKVEGITAEEAFSLTAQDFDNLSQAQLNSLAQNFEARNALRPQVFSESARIKSAFQGIAPKGLPEVARAIAADLNRTNPVTGSLTPQAKTFRAKTAADFPGAQFLFRPESNTGGLFGTLFNAEGGPILASERLNAGGPVQYFQEGDSVNAYPGGEEEGYGPPTDIGPSTGTYGMSIDPSTGQYSDAFSRAINEPISVVEDIFGLKITPLEVAETAFTLANPLGKVGLIPGAARSFSQALSANQSPNAPVTSLSGAVGRGIANVGINVKPDPSYPGDVGYTSFSETMDVDDPLQGGQ